MYGDLKFTKGELVLVRSYDADDNPNEWVAGVYSHTDGKFHYTVRESDANYIAGMNVELFRYKEVNFETF